MEKPQDNPVEQSGKPFVVVLGVSQDGGHPHPGCHRPCCQQVWDAPHLRHHVACLGVVEPNSGQTWLIDATPDFPHQLMWLQRTAGSQSLAGIILTHAHMGHVIGLSYLGREALNTRELPVWTMPRLSTLLRENQPYQSLLSEGHIKLTQLSDGQDVELVDNLRVTPFLVPHRDELSETIGIRIDGPTASLAYVPDCDTWNDWIIPVEKVISEVDFALLDGTFFSSKELEQRNRSDVRHPTVKGSMKRFVGISPDERDKINFIHFNHTNPLLNPESHEAKLTAAKGFHFAQELDCFGL